jgi:tetratricopeptide (TPR) repeat protein
LYDAARQHLPAAFEIYTSELGEEHPDTLVAATSLALLYDLEKQWGKAERLHAQTLEIQTRVLGEEHQDTLASAGSLAIVHARQGHYAEAERLMLRTLEIQTRVLGADHHDTQASAGNLAALYTLQGRLAEAEPLHRKDLEARKRMLGEEHPDTLGTTTNLGLLYNKLGRYEDAAAMFETSLPIKRRVLGMQHPWTASAMHGLAEAYTGLGRRDEALPLHRGVLEFQIAAAEAPDASPQVLGDAAWSLLTHEFEELRDPERALPLVRRACERSSNASAAQFDLLALALFETGDVAGAVETARQALELVPEDAADDRAEYAAKLARYEAALPARAPDGTSGDGKSR